MGTFTASAPVMEQNGYKFKNTNGIWYFKEINRVAHNDTVDACDDIHISINIGEGSFRDQRPLNTPHVSLKGAAGEFRVYYDFIPNGLIYLRTTKNSVLVENEEISKPYAMFADVVMRDEAKMWKLAFTPCANTIALLEEQRKQAQAEIERIKALPPTVSTWGGRPMLSQ